MCPTHALAMTVNGKPEVPVIKGKAFPMLMRTHGGESGAAGGQHRRELYRTLPLGSASARMSSGMPRARSWASGTCGSTARVLSTARTAWKRGRRAALRSPSHIWGACIWMSASVRRAARPAPMSARPTPSPMTASAWRWTSAFASTVAPASTSVPCRAPSASCAPAILHPPVESAAWAQALDKLVSYREVGARVRRQGPGKRREMAVKALLAGDEDKA